MDVLCPQHPPSSSASAGLVAQDESLVRLGILGTANIARKNVLAAAPVSGLEFSAIASRSLDKAEAFAKEYNIAKAYGSYDELLADEEIDAVYVPLPTTLHLEWVTKAAKAKKHVLCEKPCAVSGEELDRILRICEEEKVVFMDGVMFMHHDRLTALCDVLSPSKFGTEGPLHVASEFCFPGPASFFENNIRANPDCDFLGSLGDLGWYNIRFALFCFGWELPQFAVGTTHVEAKGVPLDVSGSLTWSPIETNSIKRARSTTFHCSFMSAHQQYAVVSGSQNSVRLEDFVICHSNDKAGWELRDSIKWSMDENGSTIESSFTRGETGKCRQESKMLEGFRNYVNASKNGSASVNFWPAVALVTQLCVDAVMESCQNGGAKVKVDKNGIFDAYLARTN